MINPEQPVKQYKGVWLPKEILDNPDLTPTEKILLAIIETLDDEEVGGCYASNEYLGDKLGTSGKAASNLIASLKKKGYLFQTKFDGRVRFVRTAVPSRWNLHPQNVDPGSTNCGVSEQGCKQGSDIKEDTKEGNYIATEVESEVRMKPSVLFMRLRAIFPKSRNDNRKKQIESVRRLQEDFDLSDETIIMGAKVLAQRKAWHIDGVDVPITLASLLLTDDLEKTARKLITNAESGLKSKTHGGPSNVD